MIRIVLVLMSCACAMHAVVVRSGDGDDDGWHAAKDPYSFGDLDGNGDGRIDGAEWKAGRAQLERAIKETRAAILETLDRDDSGRVSRYEAAEGKPRMMTLWAQTRALAVAAHDQDGDGKLLNEERKVIVARVTAMLAKFGARVDADGDRRIERVEAEDAIVDVIEGRRKLFSLCDRDNDGQLKQQEIDLSFNLLRAIAGD